MMARGAVLKKMAELGESKAKMFTNERLSFLICLSVNITERQGKERQI